MISGNGSDFMFICEFGSVFGVPWSAVFLLSKVQRQRNMLELFVTSIEAWEKGSVWLDKSYLIWIFR